MRKSNHSYLETCYLSHIDTKALKAFLLFELVEENQFVFGRVEVEAHGAVLDGRVVFILYSELMIVSGKKTATLTK